MANLLPEDWIEEVRSANDIVDVVSEYLALKPVGKGFFGLCPFHNEKTASFHVEPERQIFHCFGCGSGGNVITFIMNIEKLEFVDAVKFLAERAGIPLPDSLDAGKYNEAKNYRQKLYDINREAAKFYHRQLFSPQGEKPFIYLKSRGLDLKTIKAFGLGYAPDSWDVLKKLLMDMGYQEKILIEAGVVVENKGKTYDRFRNRIIFPIIDSRGFVVGFGGRVMDNGLPKYLNSSDSPIFNKSNTLFGLNMVKKQRPLENIIVVEGYMDVITLYQFGFKNAVASLGTSLTQNQAKLLRRYVRDVFIAYDGDSAGQKATLRGLDILRDAGCRVKVLQFPQGLDPDEVLRQYGAEYFKRLMDQAISLVDYKLEQLQKMYDLKSQDDKVKFATEAAKILLEVDNILERDVHIQRIKSLTGFKPELLYQQLKHIEAKTKGGRVKKNIIGNNRHTRVIEGKGLLIPSHIKAERHLVWLMAQSESIARKVISRLDRMTFDDKIHREVADIIIRLLEKGKDINPAQILSFVEDQDMVRKVTEIFNLEIEYDNVEKYIADCMDEIIRHRLEKRRQELKEQITKMDQENTYDPVKYKSLLQEVADLTKRLKKSGHGKEDVV